MEQLVSKALKITDPQSTCNLIQETIDTPGLYTFSSLLDTPSVNALSNLDTPKHFQKFYNLLELFAYGTYSQWSKNKANYPDLTSNSTTKLRHLSIISLASGCRTISYSVLCESLGIENIRQLEDLIIEAFYANIVKGKLDQANNQLEVDFTIGRDLTETDVDKMLTSLGSWCENCDVAMRTIEEQISQANLNKQANFDYQAGIENEVANLKKSIRIQSQEIDLSGKSKTSKSKGYV